MYSDQCCGSGFQPEAISQWIWIHYSRSAKRHKEGRKKRLLNFEELHVLSGGLKAFFVHTNWDFGFQLILIF
jgi:hypothetical protein